MIKKIAHLRLWQTVSELISVVVRIFYKKIQMLLNKQGG